MRFEDQVVSLELSKRLKELNCKQESLWWWEVDEKDASIIYDKDFPHECSQDYNYYPAFTVAELGEMLPEAIESENVTSPHYLKIDKVIEWNVYYGKLHIESADTLANATAKMLIYLMENKLK